MVQDPDNARENYFRRPPVARMVEDIVGCKWSLEVIGAVRKGVVRPGALQRSIQGISTKVLHERLAKMLRYGILHKATYPELPPRVEYRLTGFGERFVALLDEIDRLQADVSGEESNRPGG
jgi:DNA-binding HxlR family transcriptional regulator